MVWLGATPAGTTWHLPVLNEVFEVDVSAGLIRTGAGDEVGPAWQVLALHYLAVSDRPEETPPEVTFASLASGRAYAVVYDNRVNRRLCGTVGQDRNALEAAAATVGGRDVDGGDAAFEASIFPRVTIRLVWHAGDEEFHPSCTLLLPRNMERFLCTEDIVVMSEALVARLTGRPF